MSRDSASWQDRSDQPSVTAQKEPASARTATLTSLTVSPGSMTTAMSSSFWPPRLRFDLRPPERSAVVRARAFDTERFSAAEAISSDDLTTMTSMGPSCKSRSLLRRLLRQDQGQQEAKQSRRRTWPGGTAHTSWAQRPMGCRDQNRRTRRESPARDRTCGRQRRSAAACDWRLDSRADAHRRERLPFADLDESEGIVRKVAGVG